GVNEDLASYGAAPTENSFSVDGVNMTNTASVGVGFEQFTGGEPTHRPDSFLLNYDQNWIDQVQVTGIGAPAEYGGFTGVAANFSTRSGGNQFHGLFETFFQNQNMIDSNSPNPPSKLPFKTYDISTQLGGPILKDKLWFFTGYEYPHTQTQSDFRGD